MEKILDIIPQTVLYFLAGYVYLYTYYCIRVKRLNLNKEIEFKNIIIVGAMIYCICQFFLPINSIKSPVFKSIVIILLSAGSGVIISYFSKKTYKYRRITPSEAFWFEILQELNNETWMVFVNRKQNYYITGMLFGIDENESNPYICLSMCGAFDLLTRKQIGGDTNSYNYKCIIKPSDFDEIYFMQE